MQIVFHRICTRRHRADRTRSGSRSSPRCSIGWPPNAKPGAVQIKTVAQAIGGAVAPRGRRARPDRDARGAERVVRRRQLGAGRADLLGAHGVERRQRRHLVARPRRAFRHVGRTCRRVDDHRRSRLVVAQDEGTCAAPVTVGDRYTYAVWYRSNAPIQLVSYRRLAGRRLPDLRLEHSRSRPHRMRGPTPPPSPAPMPADSTGISIGVAIKTAGQFSFDDFSLVDSGPPPPVTAGRGRHRQQHAERVPAGDPDRRRGARHRRRAPELAGRAGSRSGRLLVLAALALALIDRRIAHRRRRR